MPYKWICISGLAALSWLASFRPAPIAPKLRLSEYGFFLGKMSDLQPAHGVFPYEVNAPLFSDYAEKARFIYLPERQKMTWRDSSAFTFPVGAVLIKNFYYYHHAAHPEQGKRILETRLLIREEKGWKALEYLWNAEQTEAVLEVAGASLPVVWKDAEGRSRQLPYIVPNLNQCKGCHSYDGQFVPLGTTARQLNRAQEGKNQLVHWQQAAVLDLPAGFDTATAPRLTDYRLWRPGTDPMLAARAYLDGNCAHCHNPHGPASTSGMFLEYDQIDPQRLGLGKPPVAAGRGSGQRKYGLVAGKPQESILVYRMESDDPGIRMPELGRQTMHREGVELIKAWIKAMR